MCVYRMFDSPNLVTGIWLRQEIVEGNLHLQSVISFLSRPCEPSEHRQFYAFGAHVVLGGGKVGNAR